MTIRPFRFIAFDDNEYFVRDHRGIKICEKVFVCHECFYKKLLSYTITAFGYEINNNCEFSRDINPKFDRTDVIKALDFWIEYWVYQNKKDYILEGTVNKDFELTVRELIETREAVLKCPADTEFVRQKIRSIAEIKEIKPKMVEFTENVLQDGNSSSASTVDQFCYVFRRMTYKEYMKRKPYHPADMRYDIFHENFRDNGQRFRFGVDDEVSGRTWSGGRHIDEVSVRERALHQISAGTTLTNRTLDANENTIIDTVRERPPNASSTDQPSLVFENIIATVVGGIQPGLDINDFMTVPVRFSDNKGNEISMNIFFNNSTLVDGFTGPLGTVHRIRITPGSQNPVEIDGQNYHVVDINISYNPRNSLPFIFRDLWVESVEATQNTLRVDFGSEHRQYISLTLQVDRTMRNEFLSQQGGRSCDLEITGGNSVRINNNGFEVTEPINIMIR